MTPEINPKIQDSFLLAEKIIRRVSLNIARRVESQLHGNYTSIFHGTGLDFKEIREYSTNDDIRTLDWNATARLGRPHVRVYEEERDHTVWLVLDISPSMDFGSRFTTKKDVMVQFAALMGYLAYKRGDKTGAILFNKGIKDIIPPEKGLKQVYRIVKQLLDIKNTEKEEKDFDFSRIVNIIGRKKSMFFISDFIFPDCSWQKPFGEICLKNDVIPVKILDPVEENIPEIGYINLLDPETGKALTINASNPEVLRRYSELLRKENNNLDKTFSLLRINPVKIYTDSDIAQVLVDYSHRRQYCTASA